MYGSIVKFDGHIYNVESTFEKDGRHYTVLVRAWRQDGALHTEVREVFSHLLLDATFLG